MDRRTFLLAGLAGVALAAPASAQTVKRRFNFGSTFSRRNAGGAPNYSGKRLINYDTRERPGTIIIDTSKRRLYFVMGGGKAWEYGVGVGRAGFEWSGTARIARRAKWPAWRPPAEMIEREKVKYGRTLPAVMEGGPANPLGARALYLFQGKKDTLYRIHGTNAPQTIGRAMSSGCIRMLNEEVIDLYERVKIGAKVIVL